MERVFFFRVFSSYFQDFFFNFGFIAMKLSDFFID